jgi:hypothetical protein
MVHFTVVFGVSVLIDSTSTNKARISNFWLTALQSRRKGLLHLLRMLCYIFREKGLRAVTLLSARISLGT